MAVVAARAPGFTPAVRSLCSPDNGPVIVRRGARPAGTRAAEEMRVLPRNKPKASDQA